MAGGEDSYCDHLPPVADRTFTQRLAGQFFVEVAVVELILPRNDIGQSQRDTQQLAALSELGLAIAVAEKTVVTDALKTVRQDMEQKAANEFAGLQSQRFLLVVVTVIFPTKGDLAVVDVQQAVIGNGNAVRVQTQVVQDLFGTAEGRFGVNHPFGLAKRRQIGGKGFRVTEPLQR